MARLVTATLLLIAAIALISQAGAQTLDPTFGTGGTVTPTPLGGIGTGDALIPASAATDGRTYVGGKSNLSGAPYVLALREDGTPDPSFGFEGAVTIKGPDILSGQILGLALGPGGRVFATGLVKTADSNGDGDEDTEGLIVGFEPDGTLLFGAPGYVTVPGVPTDALAFFRDVVPYRSGACAVGRMLEVGTDLAILACVKENGRPLRYFGTNGVSVLEDLPGTVVASAITVDSDYRLLITGSINGYSAGKGGLAARVLPDGTLDPTFSADGFTILTPLDLLNPSYGDITMLPDGRSVATGVGSKGPGVSGALVTLLTASGEPDPTFGFEGSIWVNGPSGEVSSGLSGVVLADGTFRFISRATGGSSNPTVAVIGTDSEGNLLPYVGTNGILLLDGGDATFTALEGGYDNSGRLNVVGYQRNGTEREGLVLRYSSGASLSVLLEPKASVDFPPSGGVLRARSLVRNEGITPEVVDLWLIATFPDGTTSLIGAPLELTLSPDERYSKRYRFRIPGTAQMGKYVLTANVGTFPGSARQSDPFIFTKAGPAPLTASPDAMIELLVGDSDITVAPNPTQADAWVEAASGATVTVQDALGREVGRFVGNGSRLTLPASRWAPGIYSVTVQTEGDVQTTRLTVVR